MLTNTAQQGPTGRGAGGKDRRAAGEWRWRVLALLPWAAGLGIVTSIGVAWGLGVTVWVFDLVTSVHVVYDSASHVEDGTAQTHQAPLPVIWGASGLRMTLYELEAANHPLMKEAVAAQQALDPALVFETDADQARRGRDITVMQQGLPLRCFQGADFPDAWPEPTSTGLFKVGELGEHVICYQPRWPAFVADTLFWGALWLGVLAVPAAMRGTRRRRKGLCPACAYDLRGELEEGCPECGWNREDARPRTLTASPASPGTP